MTPFTEPLGRLIEALKRLPGIGPKSAQRLAFFLLQADLDYVINLSQAISEARQKIRLCDACNNYTDGDICGICADPRRDQGVICVVEKPFDIAALEKSARFRGIYHGLHGSLSPINGIGPEELKLANLMARVRRIPPQEVILATNPDVEGEATAIYLARLLQPLGIATSRIALGLPMGSNLEYADEVTIQRALDGRTPLR